MRGVWGVSEGKRERMKPERLSQSQGQEVTVSRRGRGSAGDTEGRGGFAEHPLVVWQGEREGEREGAVL